MANYRVSGTLEFQDCNGDRDILRLHTRYADTATLATLATDIGAINTAFGNPGHISNAKVVGEGLSVLWDVGVLSQESPAAAQSAEYSTVQDKALLSFANNNGSRRNVYLPAPIEAMFDTPPSDVVVDATYADLATLITALEGILSDASEAVFTAISGATYMGRRRHRNKARG
jgi:hypothetical protein